MLLYYQIALLLVVLYHGIIARRPSAHESGYLRVLEGPFTSRRLTRGIKRPSQPTAGQICSRARLFFFALEGQKKKSSRGSDLPFGRRHHPQLHSLQEASPGYTRPVWTRVSNPFLPLF